MGKKKTSGSKVWAAYDHRAQGGLVDITWDSLLSASTETDNKCFGYSASLGKAVKGLPVI
jgi:hypothetical protein